ncbi:hypothetical protein DFR42_10762 [Undibacterium pigrum]|uniref:Uncharacterized protein n=1 Tax=Undibacterium pigrum TaxID=401470 RepID=A0A318J3Z7_9BURK|nr:hypothetical protein DFR42_10762 [Undibacterium pigrum]
MPAWGTEIKRNDTLVASDCRSGFSREHLSRVGHSRLKPLLQDIAVTDTLPDVAQCVTQCAAQCCPLPENTFITITPAIISAMPSSAGISSFCPNTSQPTAVISTIPTPDQTA